MVIANVVSCYVSIANKCYVLINLSVIILVRYTLKMNMRLLQIIFFPCVILQTLVFVW